MNIDISKNDNVSIITLEGRLDATTAPMLDTCIKEMPNDITSLIIDMKNVNYISSAGLRILLAAQKKMNQVGSMKLLNVCESIIEIFEITGFIDFLMIE